MGDIDKQILFEILKTQKEKHRREWEGIQDKVLITFKKFKESVSNNITLNDVREWREKLPSQIYGMFRYLIVNDKLGKELLSTESFSILRAVLEQLESTNDFEESLKLFLTAVNDERIKGARVSVISTWFAIFKPQFFLPIWGTTGEGAVITSKLQEEANVKIGNLLNNPKSAVEFIKLVKEVSQGLGIDNMIESAYYLSKYSERSYHEYTEEKSSNDTSTWLSKYLTSKGYYFPTHLVSQFYVALKTKGFAILSGLTGTGKTKIAQELAELLDSSKENFLFLSVRPDWRDSKALLGYYNPLTGEYQRTELLDFILRAVDDYQRNGANSKPYFLLLDEMNLAHVEYYFADFLSVLESGREENGFTRESIKLHDIDDIAEKKGIPRELKFPPNLYIIGTVNMDETTYAFSPKVLDRAFVVEFHDVDLENYPSAGENSSDNFEALREVLLNDLRGSNGKFLAHSKEEINETVKELKTTEYWKIIQHINRALEPYDLHFGYRVIDEIALFFKNAKESKEKGIVMFESEDEIFDLALLMKVLPKFHGNRKKLEKPLKEVLRECIESNFEVKFKENNTEKTIKLPSQLEKLNSFAIVEILRNWESYNKNFRFKHTAKKVLRMLRQLYEIGFASFS
ncbi:hypothetical protein OCC_12034 [Thermococcus litoralis DSM 5473]|uniref:AAA+ ATPase domain-containing protein n=1 Tax=Thermococcus litoralis (strain ATCC 51850 / DSM 5473 / JCM 8560 / NS-C) TaxID=523849 RepID=H3ZL92_THELN|nr:AAA family ATPase [Thermococcus litoralis]EHR78361.1 hypothetical protein OCC_12034 [Thermococcus litoralis DSM 5473]